MQEKTSKDWKRRFLIYCSWGLCSMDYLQLPFIRVEKAVSWTQRFLTQSKKDYRQLVGTLFRK